jgi:N-acetylglucosamine kinase-like BadF-type ATPase
VGLEAAAASVRQALAQASLQPGQVAAGCFGLAGRAASGRFHSAQPTLDSLNLAQQVTFKAYPLLALRANTPNSVGLVISAERRMAAAIRTPQGAEWHSAWYSQEGTGEFAAGEIAAGEQALQAVFQAADGRGRPTMLTELVLRFKGLSSPVELARLAANGLASGEAGDEFKASLAPLLFQAHQHYADPVAADILLAIGQSLSSAALSLLERHSLLRDPFPVVLAGGLFKGEGNLLLESVRLNLHARAPHARLVLARQEPVLGALLFAFDPLGERVTPEQIGRLQATLPAPGFFRN